MMRGDREWEGLEPILTSLTDPVVVEGGAYTGSEMKLMSSALKTPFRYYAFEPHPHHARFIRKRGIPAGVTFFEAALSHARGEATLHVCCTRYDGSSSIRTPAQCLERYRGMTFPAKVQVETWSIDALAAEERLDHIDLVFADIQGAERDLIEGAFIMKAHTRWMCLECDPPKSYEGGWSREQMLEGLGPGWEITANFGQDTLFTNKAWTPRSL